MMRSGLRNNSNECFINSALQCLAISPVIKDFIANYAREDEKLIEVICKFKLGKFKADEINIECERILKEHSDIIDASEKHILSKLAKNSSDIFIYISFKQMIINMNTNLGTVLNNARFLSIIKEITEGSGFEHLFSSGDQQDPHELLVYLFDKLHSAKSTKVNIDIPGNVNDMNEILQTYVKDFKARYENDYSYFVKNFYYYIVNCVECKKCTNKTLNMCPSDIITVSVPNELLGGGITIYDSLNNMFKIENIQYKCEKCGNEAENRIEKKILTKSNTLIIKIKRYELVGKMLKKINKFIQYPLILDIKNYYCGEGSNTKYELYGLINHSGIGIDGGHYYSFIRNTEEDGKFTDNWQCCNDERVSSISQEEALSSSNAYILFYTLIN